MNPRSNILLLAVLAISAVFGSCIEKEIDFDVLKASRDYSLEVAQDVEILYSDSAVLRVRIVGPELKRYIYKFKVEEVFTEGVDVEFFDQYSTPQAWMRANYAKRKQREKVVVARDSVVLRNAEGESLHTYELIWDERDNSLATDHFVMITRPPSDTIYSRGFKSNQDFTEYVLYSVEGDMTFKSFEATQQSSNQ